MNLVRKYKLSKILNNPLTIEEYEIYYFIKDWIKDLIIFKYNNSIFYMKNDGRWVLEESDNFLVTFVRYAEFWEILEKKYRMSKDDARYTIKFFIEEELNKKCKTPYSTIGNTQIESLYENSLHSK